MPKQTREAHVQAVLVDIDGTLLDSNHAHAVAWSDALRDFEYEVTVEVVRSLIGMGGDKLLRVVADLDPEEGKGRQIAARKTEIFSALLPRIHPTPGARLFVERLIREGIVVVVATSASENEAWSLLEQAGVASQIDSISTPDDLASKPEPDVVLRALALAGTPPQRTVLIGDTPFDVDAALRAGVATIAMRCGGWWADEALGRALAIYDHPKALRAEFDNSALAGPGWCARHSVGPGAGAGGWGLGAGDWGLGLGQRHLQ